MKVKSSTSKSLKNTKMGLNPGFWRVLSPTVPQCNMSTSQTHLNKILFHFLLFLLKKQTKRKIWHFFTLKKLGNKMFGLQYQKTLLRGETYRVSVKKYIYGPIGTKLFTCWNFTDENTILFTFENIQQNKFPQNILFCLFDVYLCKPNIDQKVHLY